MTNFDRLYNSPGFSENFNINIDNADVKVGKVSEVKRIYEDIIDKSVNSRNTNTADNIKKYLELVLEGKDKDKRITGLSDDNETDEEIENDEEENPTRLFRPNEFRLIKKHIKKEVLKELKQCPVNKYPNILLLATRAVLDTLRNIYENDLTDPKAIGKNDLQKYSHSHPNFFSKNEYSKCEKLIDRLCEHAHNLNKVSTSAEIENNRPLVNKLIINLLENFPKKT